jgi:hypothetical protein
MATLSVTRFITLHNCSINSRQKKLGGKGPQTDKQLPQSHFALLSMQDCGSGSVLDPGQWIRIRNRNPDPDLDPGGQNNPQK